VSSNLQSYLNSSAKNSSHNLTAVIANRNMTNTHSRKRLSVSSKASERIKVVSANGKNELFDRTKNDRVNNSTMTK
jgi:hypothetical protein